MCDTLVALSNSTEDGSVIVAKNSDREPNECQVVRYFPRARHPPGSRVHCTYMEIPQVDETNEIILSSPYWMWGAEMGANEFGVAIGNESAWSKEPADKSGLLGMDYIRLALERSDTARKALDTITSLLEKFGQGGNASATGQTYYQNSYLIASPREAWVLETSGRHWVAQRVHDVQSISNGYTIDSKWDLSSEDLVRYAEERGWCRSAEEFSFTRCYSDEAMRSTMACVERRNRTLVLLRDAKGSINVETMMKLLRDHGEKAETWVPSRGTAWKGSIMGGACMHSTPSVVSSSTGSYVGHLANTFSTHWFTGTSYPCVSVFIPMHLGGSGGSEILSRGGNTYDDNSPWWRHERLARIIQLDYAARAPPIQKEMNLLERKFMGETQKMRHEAAKLSKAESAKALKDLTDKLSKTVYDQMAKWITAVSGIGDSENAPIAYRNYWNRINSKANLRL